VSVAGSAKAGDAREVSSAAVDAARVWRDVTDPAKGFALVRGFYSPDEVDWYRERSDALLASSPIMHAQVVHGRQRDYVFPRVTGRIITGYQVFHFPHNHRGTDLEAFFRRAIDFRNEVESQWADDAYRRDTAPLRDYVQVNYFPERTGKLAKHVDQGPDLPSLLLQPWVSLSEPGDDYTRGNLVIHSKDGSAHAIEHELGVHRGDLLLFDRSLVHEVEATAPGTGANRGRCNAVMGGRQAAPSALSAAYRRLFFTQPAFSAIWAMFGWRRKLMAAAASHPRLGRVAPPDWLPADTPRAGDVYKPQARVDTRRLGIPVAGRGSE
jgi:hypothetical protein